jgi:hypothetical protein
MGNIKKLLLHQPDGVVTARIQLVDRGSEKAEVICRNSRLHTMATLPKGITAAEAAGRLPGLMRLASVSEGNARGVAVSEIRAILRFTSNLDASALNDENQTLIAAAKALVKP